MRRTVVVSLLVFACLTATASASAQDCGSDAPCPSYMLCAVEHSECRPRWTQPCDDAAQCGEGFDCNDEGRCEPQEDHVACEVDSDCPAHWRCSAGVDTSRCLPPATRGEDMVKDETTVSEPAAAAGGCSVEVDVEGLKPAQPPLAFASLVVATLVMARRRRKAPSR